MCTHGLQYPRFNLIDDAIPADLDAPQVENDFFELLVGKRAAASGTPRRHHPIAAIVERVQDLVFGEAGENRVESGGYPAHLGDELSGF